MAGRRGLWSPCFRRAPVLTYLFPGGSGDLYLLEEVSLSCPVPLSPSWPDLSPRG